MDIKNLISWSTKNYSNLPWRKDRSLYSTWISEVMLQQTTVYTVKSRLTDFIKKFPSISDLANAQEEDLLVAWKGLGYYQRAKNLKKAAKYINDKLGGEFPQNIEKLQSIPGIGPYTSSAILSIGMDKKAIAIDANLERVLSRYYGIKVEKGPKLKDEIQKRFNQRLIINSDIKSWRNFNEAVMDLGREICRARRVDCVLCPIKRNCQAYASDSPLEYPFIAVKNKKEKHELDLIRFISIDEGSIAVVRKKTGQWLAGQYELPTYVLKTTDKKFNQYPVNEFDIPKNLPSIKTGITKYKIKNYFVEISKKQLSSVNCSEQIEVLDLCSIKNKLSTASLKILAEFEKRERV